MILLWAGLGFIAGLAVGSLSSLSTWLLLLVAGLVALLLPLSSRWRFSTLNILALAALLGCARAQALHSPLTPHDVGYFNGHLVTLSGVISTEPDVRDTGNDYVVSVRRLHGRRVAGSVQIFAASGEQFSLGDIVSVRGQLASPRDFGSTPYRAILASRGIYSTMSFPAMRRIGRQSEGLLGAADSLREWMTRRIVGSVPQPEAVVLLALLFGVRTAQLGSLTPAFVDTGLFHLIAISGLKVAIVAGTVSALVRHSLPRFVTFAICSTSIVGYWIIAGTTVAGLRASIMWILIFLAAYLGRPTFSPVSLVLTISVMVGLDPRLIWDSGFQFTALGTAGIVFFSPFVERLLSWLPSSIASASAVTMSASLAVLPLQVADFHVFTPVAPIANGLVLPFVPITIAAAAAVGFWPHAPFTAVAFGLTHLLVWLAVNIASLPGSAIHSGALGTTISVAYFLCLCLLVVFLWRLRLSLATIRHRGTLSAGLIAACIGLSMAVAQREPPSRILFVGHDGGVLIQRHGANVLIDGGDRPSILLSTLGRAIPLSDRRLAAILLTCPKASNVAAVAAARSTIGGQDIVDVGMEYPSKTYARWRASVENDRSGTTLLRSGLSVSQGDLTIHALMPDGQYANPLDGAGILMISIGERNYLYVGYASSREQQELPFRARGHAFTAISYVPVSPVLRRGFHIHRVVHPRIGQSIALPAG